MKDFRQELIQVAAVAVAIVEDLDYGEANADMMVPNRTRTQAEVMMNLIIQERQRQDDKWGPQHHDPITWMAILMEEVGEAAEELEGAEFAEFEDQPVIQAWLWRTLFDTVGVGRRAKHTLDEFVFPETAG